MMTLIEVKNYLRVDHTEDDALILSMMDTAKKLFKDVGRMDEQAFTVNEETTRQAMKNLNKTVEKTESSFSVCKGIRVGIKYLG